MSEVVRFTIFILISLIVFVALLRFVTRRRAAPPRNALVALVASIVVVGGMLFAKFGNNAGLPWWIYYTLPALATMVLPPVTFGFSRRELLQYLALAFLSSPAIHVVFSFLFGWHEYMPFIRVPSLRQLMG